MLSTHNAGYWFYVMVAGISLSFWIARFELSLSETVCAFVLWTAWFFSLVYGSGAVATVVHAAVSGALSWWFAFMEVGHLPRRRLYAVAATVFAVLTINYVGIHFS